MVRRWAAAALVVVDTEEVSQYVVDTLLQIASICSLRPHIPIGIWVWLKKRPSLPPVCLGRRCGTTPDTIRYVRGLGDVEILKSYLLLVWSQWDDLCIGGLDEMETAIREEFGGIWVRGHRKDPYGRLEYVLERLGLGLEYLGQHNPQVKQYRIEAARGQYGRLKQVLRDVDMEAVKRLAWGKASPERGGLDTFPLLVMSTTQVLRDLYSLDTSSPASAKPIGRCGAGAGV